MLPRPGLFASRRIAPALRTRLPLGALLQSQWAARRFLRYDIALAAMTARHLIEGGTTRKNVVAWYQQMHQKRPGSASLDTFRDLIATVQHEGINSRYPVGVSRNGELLDGALRVAIALALDAEDIAVDVRWGRRLRPLGREWFRQRGFVEQALVAMDREVDRMMALNGADTFLVTTTTDDPLREWMPPFLPNDSEVLTEWSLSLAHDDVRALEKALTFVPRNERDFRRIHPEVLREGPITVLRLRLHSPKRQRVAKTSTARDWGATEMERSLRAALPEHPVVVGQTIEQNRAAIALLETHGWSHTAGQSWE